MLARELGVARQSVHELIRRGVLPIDADGLVDVELARVAILQRVRPAGKTARAAAAATPAPAALPASAENAASGTITSFHVARTIREATEARLAQLELAQRRGELVRKVDVERATFALLRGIRDRLTGVADRIAPIVAGESSVAGCHDTIAGEIRSCLTWAAADTGEVHRTWVDALSPLLERELEAWARESRVESPALAALTVRVSGVLDAFAAEFVSGGAS